MTVLNNLYQYDLRMLLWCGKSRCNCKFMRLVRFISYSGDGYLQLLLPLTLLLFLSEKGESFFWLVAGAFAIERPLYLILKNSLKRRRPPDIVPYFTSVVSPSDRFSFPSGHTMGAFLLADLSYLYFGPIALPLYIWASAVGASRVLLGVHFPSDILAGAAISTLLAGCYMI
jgi:undecaprenyl-diphosphatase